MVIPITKPLSVPLDGFATGLILGKLTTKTLAVSLHSTAVQTFV